MKWLMDGLLADINLRGSYLIAASHRLVAGITATFANADALQSLFGVDAT